MIRVLTFTNEDAIRLTLLWFGKINGADVERRKDQKPQTREDRKSEGRIDKALRSVSYPDPTAPEPKADASGLTIDRRTRILNADGGTIRLDQGDFERLKRYVAQAPWLEDLSAQVSDLEDWLEACPQVKDE